MKSRVFKIFLWVLGICVACAIVAAGTLTAIALKKNSEEEFSVAPAVVPEEATDSSRGVLVGKPFPVGISAELAFAFSDEPKFLFELPEGLEAVEKISPQAKFAWTHRNVQGDVFLVAFHEGEFSDAKIKIRAEISGTADFVEKEITLPEIFATLPEPTPDEEITLAGERPLPGEDDGKETLLAICIAVVVCIAIAVFLLIKKRSREKVIPEDPSWVVAEKSLNELKGDVVAGRKSAILAIARLSDVVRRYLTKRFEVSADAMTTPEFFAEMERGTSPLSPTHRHFLREFLSDADRVKFAGVSATSEHVISAIDRAGELVKETIPVQQPEDAEKKGGAH